MTSKMKGLVATFGPPILVGLAAFLTAWNTRENDFVWDDRAAILSNRDIDTTTNGSSISELFMNDFWGKRMSEKSSHKSYRPLTVLSFRVNFYYGHDNPRGYHMVNIVIHALCAILVWMTAHNIFKHYRVAGPKQQPSQTYPFIGALIAGLLFAVHPIHCDAVASVVGRADILCTMFALCGFLFYTRSMSSNIRAIFAFISSIICAILASLSKELGFTSFGLYFVYDILIGVTYPYSVECRRSALDNITARKIRLITLLITTLGLVALRIMINGEHIQADFNMLANNIAVEESRMVRMMSYAHVHAWYLWKLLWPSWLSFDYGFDTIPVIRSFGDERNGLTLVAYGAVLSGIYIAFCRVRTSPLLLCISFGIIPFVPASNIFFPVGTVVAERLLYFPSVGFCLLIGYLAQHIAMIYRNLEQSKEIHIPTQYKNVVVRTRPLTSIIQPVLIICSVTIIFAGGYRSHVRNMEWKSEDVLYISAVKVAPTNIKALNNAVKMLLNTDPEQAIQYSKVSIGLLSEQIDGQSNLGLVYAVLKQPLLALRHLAKSFDFSTDEFPGAGFLGTHLYYHWLRMNEVEMLGERPHIMERMMRSPTIQLATQYIDTAIARKSHYPSHFYTRGVISYQKGDYELAQQYIEAAAVANNFVASRQKDHELMISSALIQNMLGVLHRLRGDNQAALSQLLEAIQQHPDEVDLYINAGMISLELKQKHQAEALFEQVLNLAKNAEPLASAARLLENVHQHKAAIVLYEKAISLAATETERTVLTQAKDRNEVAIANAH